MKEKELHAIVKAFLITGKKCIDARVNAGHKYVGYADVFGIKDVGGQYESEVIGYAVEVKKWRRPFGRHIGQALGYSLFSHRCYFAVPDNDPFDEEDIEMANRLGVGLIQINVDEKSCKEVLTAKHQQPIQGLFLYVVEMQLGYGKCSICKEFFKIDKWSTKSPSKALKDERAFYKTIINKDVYYTRHNKRWPLIICKNCLRTLEFNKK